MADNVPITAGSGTTIGTSNRTINAISVQVQKVDEQGSPAVATGQVAPTTTAATLVASRDSRKRLVLLNVGTVDVYIGPATVTTANGFKLVAGSSVTLYLQALIQAITGSGTGAIHYIEEYDTYV